MHRQDKVFLLLMLLAMAIESQALYPPKEMTVVPYTPRTTKLSPAFLGPPPPPITIPSTTHESSSPTTSNSVISPQEYRSAIIKTSLTVMCACLFGVFLTLTRGKSTGYEFFCSYLVEQSLSIDNLFVFIMLFDYFKVPMESQSRVLAWGIGGAIVLRGIMIMVGVAVLQRFKSVMLGFAAILLASSFKLLTESHNNNNDDDDLKDNVVMKIASFLFPNTSHDFHGQKFFVQKEGRRFATPLLLCLVCVELSDFVFAVDSIPAVLGVTQDPLVVYTSNIFAIMALRSLYTVVAKAVSEWAYLKPAVALVLGFVGTKMILEYFHVHVGTDVSLGVICSLLGGGVALSIWDKRKTATEETHTAGVETVDVAGY
jgi:TerC family integral membrane protein